MKTRKLHMIGNAHIDPVWLWQWQEGYHEVKATFRSALDRMKEFPDFIFVASSAAFYEWVEQSDPAMFAEIQQRVREGRWDIVGGWWVEPDCNIPSGESFVRHGLYGQRYFKEKFGVTARTGFNVDSFGHAGTLPQILKKSGLDYYVFLRPMPHEQGLPARLFWWQSDDSSRVLAYRIPFEYLSWGKDVEFYARRSAAEMKEPVDEFMCFYGVGNHGGGPTIANLENIHCLDADPDFRARLILSTPEEFFCAAETKDWPIPVVHSELQHHASGCYAAHSGIKRWNRLAENRLLAAEKMSVAVDLWAGAAVPGAPDEFRRAWKNVLFNQFHDIMAGTSLEAAYDDARDAYGEALAIAGRALNHATQSIAWKIGIPQEENTRPLVVFNPLTWPVKANVEIESPHLKSESVLVDDAGKIIPHQAVQSSTVAGRSRLCFTADLPALGYRTYRLLSSSDTARDIDTPFGLQSSDTALENGRFRLEFDPVTGWISSLRDKWEDVEVFCGPAALPVVLEDSADTWGHDVFRWDKAVGEFKAESVRLAEDGPVKSIIRVTSKFGSSSLVQDFAMYRDREPIDVSVVVDWHEKCKMLKLRFPVSVNFMKITHEVAYGHTERCANGEEEPTQSWVDVSGISRGREILYGFSLLNDGKYSLDVNVRDIGLTVLRSPAYAHHTPAVLGPDGSHAFIDQGIQRFHYTLLPHAGSWETAGTVRRAAELNQPPIALFGTFHPEGTLPQSNSFLTVEPESVIVTVLKQAEDRDGLVLRAYETRGASARASIRLPALGRLIEAEFGPAEIKTFYIPRDPTKPVTETNLLEWPDA
ncbi:MAG TPA: glycoside hydrolase family 38 C-terminal domain-containing protein [Anaerolineales bacterium]|nr:glycoside hydrolase family 38 C-terminal domain-containing protein [Anaerolineales bacterium]